MMLLSSEVAKMFDWFSLHQWIDGILKLEYRASIIAAEQMPLLSPTERSNNGHDKTIGTFCHNQSS
jgi:hypothetical protein